MITPLQRNHTFLYNFFITNYRKSIMVGSNNSHCQIFEFVSRAECQSLREHSGLCDRKDWQYALKENKKMT